jgi:hypothetical protein
MIMDVQTVQAGYYIFAVVIVILQIVNLVWKQKNGSSGDIKDIKDDVGTLKTDVAVIKNTLNNLPCREGKDCNIL